MSICPGWSEISGHKGVLRAYASGKLDACQVDGFHLIGMSLDAELECRTAKCIGVNDVGTGIKILPVNIHYKFRFLEIPHFRYTTGWEAGLKQHGSHGTVKENDSVVHQTHK